jgi:exopolyphosphatase/guanosine-5'-triphosphate,3'-diphosphate pyrophosphatase
VRLACVDIGTNSVLLLVAEQGPSGPRALLDLATVTRLGQGVDRSGELAPEAVARTLACLAGYAGRVRELGATVLRVVGTSALRDARGAEGFLREASRLLGREPEVISGEEEARLTFRGALSGLDLPPGPVVVCDVGGGSTEIIVGEAGPEGRIDRAVSLNVGGVRLTERHVTQDPPSRDEIEAIRGEIDRALAVFAPPPAGATLIGVAGTVTTIAAVARGVEPHEGAKVHGTRLATAEVEAVAARLLGLSLAERREVAGLEATRADVIVGGVLLVERLLHWAGAEATWVSDHGVRWGLVLEEWPEQRMRGPSPTVTRTAGSG